MNKVRYDTEKDIFKNLLEYAVLAPSGHNAQPWLFRLTERDGLYLYADRTRALPVADPHDRELTISCGAALDHLEVAAQAIGITTEIDICPDSDEDDLLAIVKITGESVPDPQDLLQAIHERRTTRVKFDNLLLPVWLENQCADIANQYGLELSQFSDDIHRAAIAELVAEGDRMQYANPSFRRELAAWVHSRRHHTHDGMSTAGFGMPDILSPVGAFVIRSFDVGDGIAASDKTKILKGSPTLAVFSSPGDTVRDWLATGRAQSRVLLTLAANGLTASYLNAPVEIDELRTRVREAAGCQGIPQLLMRFGYGPTLGPMIRRGVDQVLLEE